MTFSFYSSFPRLVLNAFGILSVAVDPAFRFFFYSALITGYKPVNVAHKIVKKFAYTGLLLSMTMTVLYIQSCRPRTWQCSKVKAINEYKIVKWIIVMRVGGLGLIVGESLWDKWLVFCCVRKSTDIVSSEQGHKLGRNHEEMKTWSRLKQRLENLWASCSLGVSVCSNLIVVRYFRCLELQWDQHGCKTV